MPLTFPSLDDRSYQDLLDEALAHIRKDLNTDWNDLSAGDPGVVLLETFAFLTEKMLYQLNRLPEKAYIAFLNLLGVSLDPPIAAKARLSFWRAQTETGGETITLPRGTRIVPGGGKDDKLANAFVLAEDLEIPITSRDEPTAVETLAYHCEQVEEELGIGSGTPGQSFTVQRPPLIAPLGNWLDLVVGVEVPREEQQTGDREGADERIYRPWQEVKRFSDPDPKKPVYTVDRTLGVIQFAPAVRKLMTGNEADVDPDTAGAPVRSKDEATPLGEFPPNDRRIRVWYSRGGGEAGNLPDGVLNEILDPPSGLAAGISVINPQPAGGGADGETLANALVRGPHEFFSQDNVVTASDYEQLVKRKGRSTIARAKAYTRSTLWNYAQPGTVEIVLLPSLPVRKRRSISLKALKDNERGDDLPSIRRELDERILLGTRYDLVWARYKKVWVEADLLVKPSADSQAVKKRIIDTINCLVSPLPLEIQKNSLPAGGNTAGVLQEGWPFGQELTLTQVYKHVLDSAPDITLISKMALRIDEAPDREVHCLAADNCQPDTWYAASDRRLFRSTNNGLGWEKVLSFDADEDGPGEAGQMYQSDGENNGWRLTAERRPESVRVVCPSPDQPGVVAIATRLENETGSAPNRGASALYTTANCGETWYCLVSPFDGKIEDMAWLSRSNNQVLLLATSYGLYEVDVAFRASRELPAIPAPDEKVEIMPFLARVDPKYPAMPLYAVTVISSRGNARVAVAAKNRQGVYLSRSSNLIPVDSQADREASSNFDLLGLRGEDVRHLNVQQSEDDIFLWAATMAVGDNGKGCFRWQFEKKNLEKGTDCMQVSGGWTGGSCHALAFQGTKVLAATAWGGILTAEYDPKKPAGQLEWKSSISADAASPHIRKLDQEPDSGSEAAAPGKPNKPDKPNKRIFSPLVALASNDSAGSINKQPILMTGGKDGVYRCMQGKTTLEKVSRTEFLNPRDAVTLPPNWLFVCDSDKHKISVKRLRERSPDE